MKYFRKYLLQYLDIIQNKTNSDYMFFTIKKGKFDKVTEPNIANRLNVIFGKKVSTLILRKSAISHELNKLEKLKGKRKENQMEKIKHILKFGGSSFLQMSNYGKKMNTTAMEVDE